MLSTAILNDFFVNFIFIIPKCFNKTLTLQPIFKITMRNLFSTTILSLLSVGAFAQTTLTPQNNAPIEGESCTYNEIQFVEPGNQGPNQLWDFSNIKFTEKHPVTAFKPALTPKLEGIGAYNLSLEEDGYNYFMNSSETSLQELGYINTEKNINMVYSDPVLKMKYPFSYGDQFTDAFNGTAFFNKDYKIEFTGEISASADAYGTLILPNTVINNAMRVKTVKQGLQNNRCGQVKIYIVRYAWYAEGYRYPVLVINVVEKTFPNNPNPEITKTASIYTPQINNTPITKVIGNPGTINHAGNTDVSVVLYPNPFSEKITYNYFLKEQVPVTITLFDVTGKYNEVIVDNQIQSEGIHTGEIGGLNSSLAAGVYYLQCNFGEQVVVQKFVKLQAQ